MRNTQLVRDDCEFQIVSVAIFLKISGAHMNISFITEVKTLELIKWSYTSTPFTPPQKKK